MYTVSIDVVGMRIPTANFIYKPKIARKGKHSFAYLYKDEKVVDFQALLIKELQKQNYLPEAREWNKDEILLDVYFTFEFRYRFYCRDTSNAIKASEDALVSFLGIDDSRYITVQGRKKLLPKDREHESLTIGVRLHREES